MMRRFLLFGFLVTAFMQGFSQTGKEGTGNWAYQATAERINNLIHTKLEAKFDYTKSQLNGKVWISLKPHFYPTDSLKLDAKGMDIKQVAIVQNGKNLPLKFNYDGMDLRINLNRKYKNNETYTVYIDYTAKPDEFKGKGSAAITDAKGLYFINPRGEEKDKPTQIWTQGETEATSVWVPTIDKPNQKTTQEFYLTIPAKYVSLSNGKLVSQKKNADGTRTDYWKMDQPHAPYLFFIGVGDYTVVKDKYKEKEVSYYVEKEYGAVARKIFGGTPEMIALFSRLTGVDYPWVKYAQIVGRDYVSGAMENTTATLHQESAQQDARELVDGNRWENVIAHELFHQWFGDYVTSESWSNLTLNESFATIGSQLWNEFHYGKDFGDAERYGSTQGYLASKSESKDLVRFYYNDKEDVFDAVSYNKGAAILQMLRNYVGDSAFFKALNLYLTTNKYKSAEAQQLRLAFEEVSGRDLNWFWNQWYYGGGHPVLDIQYSYDASSKKALVIVTQKQDKIFKMPVKIALWNGNTVTKQQVWIGNKVDSFSFASDTKPDLINFDADKLLVAQKTENKSLQEYAFQYQNAANYTDRKEALNAAIKNQSDANAIQIIKLAMKDKFAPLRANAVNGLDLSIGENKKTFEPMLLTLAEHETNRPAKAAAIGKLGNYKSAAYKDLFVRSIQDSSYTVAGNALEALGKLDHAAALAEAKKLSAATTKGKLATSIKNVMAAGDNTATEALLKKFEDLPFGQEKFQALDGIFEFMQSTDNLVYFKRAVDALFKLQDQTPDAIKAQLVPALNNALKELQKEKIEGGLKEQADYIESKLPKDEKKGF